MALLEDFESFTGNLPDMQTWTDDGSSNPPSQSATFVTEGSFGIRFYSDDPSIDAIPAIYTTPIDLSSANTLYIDYRIAQSAESGGSYGSIILGLFASDFSDQVTITTDGINPPPETGTLTLDISGAAFKSAGRLYIGPNSAIGGDPFEFFFDNLRDDTGGGGGAVIGKGLITGLKLQRMSRV